MIAGTAYLKRAVSRSRTLKLVLPKELAFLNGLYARRHFINGILVIVVQVKDGEVCFYSNGRKDRNIVVLNLGEHSVQFKSGRAYFLYRPDGILYVWQRPDGATTTPVLQTQTST